MNRPNTNGWAEAHKGEHAGRMKLIESGSVLINKWWVRYAPLFMKKWMAFHLRNIVYEEAFKFKKLTLKEAYGKHKDYSLQVS